MTENKNKGTILIFGAEGATEALEYLCTGCGYTVNRLKTREELLDQFPGDNTVLLLYDFHTGEVCETASLALLTQLRQVGTKPIIAIADKEKEMLRILALNAGADDVLDHKDSTMESFARIRAQIRSYQRMSQHGKVVGSVKMKDLEMDDGRKLVMVKGHRVDLTPTEYKILRLLMENPGHVLSNKEIYERIWKMTPIGADNTIAVHIRHIREKIEENPQEPRYLQVVWGQGYKVG